MKIGTDDGLWFSFEWRDGAVAYEFYKDAAMVAEGRCETERMMFERFDEFCQSIRKPH
jgi:hypothetical protein